MLFNVYLCDQAYYCKVVVGPGTQFCTLSEVWVLRVGMSTLGHKRLCTPRIGLFVCHQVLFSFVLKTNRLEPHLFDLKETHNPKKFIHSCDNNKGNL
jgi:hypothetical protein